VSRLHDVEIKVTDHPEESRYEAQVDGEVAGFARYRRRPDAIEFFHTEVTEGYAGKGVGTALARGALDDVRAAGEKIIPTCPFIAEYVARHPEYQDMVVERQAG
jgi:uncharacterized protein